jgi:hypothetical protein
MSRTAKTPSVTQTNSDLASHLEGGVTLQRQDMTNIQSDSNRERRPSLSNTQRAKVSTRQGCTEWERRTLPCKISRRNRSNWERHNAMRKAPDLAIALLVAAFPAAAQQCPRGPIDIPALTEQIYEAKGPNVVFRAAAIGGQALIPALRQIAKPGKSAETPTGAAQVSLAKLGDAHAMSELDEDLHLNANPDYSRYARFDAAIDKLLLVGNEKAISILMDFLVANRDRPLMVYSLSDAPAYDQRYEMIKALGDIVVNAPLKGNGQYNGTLEDWILWWTRDKVKPAPLSISGDFQDPYMQCLGRKVEWGFSMGILDLAGTGDPRVVPIVKKIAGMGYPYTGYVGSKAPYIWLRHDYVELAMAELGDAKNFDIVARQVSPYAYEPGIVKLQIIGGKRATEVLINSMSSINPPAYGAYTGPLLSTLAKMVENPPLPADAAPTPENIQKWKDWWAQNKDTARFVKMPPFE